MHIPGDRHANAPANRRSGQVAAVGLTLLVAAAGGWLACQPGALDCEESDCSDWQRVSAAGGAAAGSGGMAGRGGGTAGMGGSMAGTGGGMAGMGGGGRGGMGGGAPAGPPTAATPVPGCAAYPTLGDMDKLFTKSCAQTNACHGKGAPWTELLANVWMTAPTAKAKLTCGSAPLIDMASPDKSLILLKTKDAMPKCANGSAAGTIMPPLDKDQALPAGAMKVPPLTAAEKTCIENFVKAAAGK
jgi:hypothetical protein